MLTSEAILQLHNVTVTGSFFLCDFNLVFSLTSLPVLAVCTFLLAAFGYTSILINFASLLTISRV